MTSKPRPEGSEWLVGSELPDVRELIASRQVRVALQPIVDLRKRTVLAYEALVRTTTATFRTPREMFQVATQNGCCGELGRAIRVAAVAAAPDHALFLNVHPNELHESWLTDLDDPIYRHAADVYLEITESVPLSHFRQCKEVLHAIRERGIRIVIDDLGAGYSNLRYIADLYPHVVKLDRALITGLGSDSRMQRLVASIVALCENPGAEVVAEGIETVGELLAVRDAGVHYAQGFLFARPLVPAPEVNWPVELDDVPVPVSGVGHGFQEAFEPVSVSVRLSESEREPPHISQVQGLTEPSERDKAMGK